MKHLSFFLIVFLSLSAYSNTVKTVKGNRVLMEITDGDFGPGDQVFTLDENGKKKGLIKIEKAKGGKAIGTVMKGKPAAGQGLQLGKKSGGGTNAKSENAKEPADSKESSGDKKIAVGALVGIGFNSMAVKLTNAAGETVETINASGTGYSALALMDYHFTDYLGVRLLVGLEQFSAKGESKSALCEGKTTCRTDISYIAIDGWLRYSFITGGTNVWVGAGFAVLSPGAKTSNTLDSKSISTTTAILLGAGLDFEISPDTYLPVQAEYGILPSSAQVTASYIAVRAGLAFRF